MKVTVSKPNPTAIPFEDVEYDQPFIMAEDHDNTGDGRADICWKDPSDDGVYFRLICGLGTLERYEIEEPEEELVYLIDIKEVVVVLK